MSEPLASSTLVSAARAESLAQLERAEFDLLVVGGGITGAAIAHRAAQEGLRPALVDQGDFASGTSSRSSRLIHGGLRYLKHGHVRLVHRCLKEQQRLARSAPHLVRPLSILFPQYSQPQAHAAATRCGMALYRALQPAGSARNHGRLDARLMLGQEPLLPATGLRGGYSCREYLTHDARLVWETVLAARLLGACALNYMRLVEFLVNSSGRITGGVLCDELTGRIFEARAEIVVNTTGPWSDKLTSSINGCAHRLRLTKGVHIMLPRQRLPLSQAVIFFSPRDRRPLVAIPSENLVVVGPTETEYEGEPGGALAGGDDIEYLLEALREFFQRPLTERDVVAARAGLRPLYDQTLKPAGEIKRAYHIEWHREGLLSVLGGKLTLHRQAAEETVSFLSRKLNRAPTRAPARTLQPLPGAVWQHQPEEVKELLLKRGVEPRSVKHLVETYGSRAHLLADLLGEERAWCEPIIEGLPHIRAEVAFSKRYEMAARAEDYSERRTDLELRARAEGLEIERELARLWRAAPESLAAYV